MAYIPGTRNQTNDALSRHPSGPRSPVRLHLQDDVQSPSSNCHGGPSTRPDTVHCSNMHTPKRRWYPNRVVQRPLSNTDWLGAVTNCHNRGSCDAGPHGSNQGGAAKRQRPTPTKYPIILQHPRRPDHH